MNQPQQRSHEELHKLRADWILDPCWDIEETEGFEAHKAELLAHRKEQEAKWQQQQDQKIAARARHLMCSVPIANYIIALEYRLSLLSERIEKLEGGASS